jgi:hypothetical protein
MSKEQSNLDLNTIEASNEAVQSDLVKLDDLSLTLVGGGELVVFF